MAKPSKRDRTSDIAYLRPIIERLGAKKVHRLVDACAAALEEEDDDEQQRR